MIELHRVSKVYSVGPVKVPALRDVSFRIGKGEFVVLTGASGAGKTTLLRLLYRDDLPSEGDVEVLGHDLMGMRRSQVAALRRSIGVVFQDAKLLPVRTVYENVAFVCVSSARPGARSPPAPSTRSARSGCRRAPRHTPPSCRRERPSERRWPGPSCWSSTRSCRCGRPSWPPPSSPAACWPMRWGVCSCALLNASAACSCGGGPGTHPFRHAGPFIRPMR